LQKIISYLMITTFYSNKIMYCVNILLHIICYDIWFYISHIILHQPFFYKTIHKIHHTTNYETLHFADTYVAHYLESPFQGLGILVPFIFAKFDGFSFFVALLLLNIRGMLRHDIRCIWLVGNHHILHHKYANSNFGEYWLDFIFATNCKKNN